MNCKYNMKKFINQPSGFNGVLFCLLIVVAFVFVSFQNNKNPKPTQTAGFQQDGNNGKAREQILSLSGKWISREDGSYIEEWDKDEDTLLVGAGYMVKNGKKIRSEKLAIVYENSGFYYQATIPGQNHGQTITFGPAVFSGISVIFENAKHDFPNILRYTFIGDTTLKVSVESISDSSMNFQIDLKKDVLEWRQN